MKGKNYYSQLNIKNYKGDLRSFGRVLLHDFRVSKSKSQKNIFKDKSKNNMYFVLEEGKIVPKSKEEAYKFVRKEVKDSIERVKNYQEQKWRHTPSNNRKKMKTPSEYVREKNTLTEITFGVSKEFWLDNKIIMEIDNNGFMLVPDLVNGKIPEDKSQWTFNSSKKKLTELLKGVRNFIGTENIMENILGIQFHLDESNPHVHLQLRTEERRVSTKSISKEEYFWKENKKEPGYFVPLKVSDFVSTKGEIKKELPKDYSLKNGKVFLDGKELKRTTPILKNPLNPKMEEEIIFNSSKFGFNMEEKELKKRLDYSNKHTKWNEALKKIPMFQEVKRGLTSEEREKIHGRKRAKNYSLPEYKKRNPIQNVRVKELEQGHSLLKELIGIEKEMLELTKKIHEEETKINTLIKEEGIWNVQIEEDWKKIEEVFSHSKQMEEVFHDTWQLTPESLERVVNEIEHVQTFLKEFEKREKLLTERLETQKTLKEKIERGKQNSYNMKMELQRKVEEKEKKLEELKKKKVLIR